MPPAQVWDLISDITRIGEFSPQRFQAVEQLHHVAAVDARGRAQILLGDPATPGGGRGPRQ